MFLKREKNKKQTHEYIRKMGFHEKREKINQRPKPNWEVGKENVRNLISFKKIILFY